MRLAISWAPGMVGLTDFFFTFRKASIGLVKSYLLRQSSVGVLKYFLNLSEKYLPRRTFPIKVEFSKQIIIVFLGI